MKRILNSNAYGLKALLVIGFFLIVLPLMLYAGSSRPGLSKDLVQVLLVLVKGSAAVGVILLAGFILLLAVELVQDRIIFRQYLKQRGKKKLVGGGLYECQFCGCRTVREFDTTCPVCGKRLD